MAHCCRYNIQSPNSGDGDHGIDGTCSGIKTITLTHTVVIDSIQPHCYSYNMQSSKNCEDGDPWTDGTYSGIKSITIRHGAVIDSIQVKYHLKGVGPDHAPITAPQHGGNGGSQDQFDLEEDEEVTKIEGYNGIYYGGCHVMSLTFTTNKNHTYGPYGTSNGADGLYDINTLEPFILKPRGKIVGFYGRNGIYMNQLGIYSQVLK